MNAEETHSHTHKQRIALDPSKETKTEKTTSTMTTKHALHIIHILIITQAKLRQGNEKKKNKRQIFIQCIGNENKLQIKNDVYSDTPSAARALHNAIIVTLPLCDYY